MPILNLSAARAELQKAKAHAAGRDNRRSDHTQRLSSGTLPQPLHRSSSTSADFLVSSLNLAPSKHSGPACAGLLFLFTIAAFAQGCGAKKCATLADCGSGDVCVQTLAECRKSCASANDCSGNTLCTGLGAGQSACLNPTDKSKNTTTSDDESFANQNCDTDPNACGENAPLCIAPLAANPDSSLRVCSFECPTGLDNECQASVPPNCTGDCAQTFAHSCCVPSEDIFAVDGNGKSTAAPVGAKTVNGAAVKTYCEPRLVCFDFPKRCNVGDTCPGARAGTCQPSGDGGACTAGTRDYFECCTRNGQCGANNPLCLTGVDNFGGYCTKPCTGQADANGHDDCYDPTTPYPNATCGLTEWVDAHVVNPTTNKEQCFVVVANPAATSASDFRGYCHVNKFPCLPDSPAGQCNFSAQHSDNTKTADLMDCNITSERPRDDTPDNLYCEALHYCYNKAAGDTCPQ